MSSILCPCVSFLVCTCVCTCAWKHPFWIFAFCYQWHKRYPRGMYAHTHRHSFSPGNYTKRKRDIINILQLFPSNPRSPLLIQLPCKFLKSPLWAELHPDTAYLGMDGDNVAVVESTRRRIIPEQQTKSRFTFCLIAVETIPSGNEEKWPQIKSQLAAVLCLIDRRIWFIPLHIENRLKLHQRHW